MSRSIGGKGEGRGWTDALKYRPMVGDFFEPAAIHEDSVDATFRPFLTIRPVMPPSLVKSVTVKIGAMMAILVVFLVVVNYEIGWRQTGVDVS